MNEAVKQSGTSALDTAKLVAAIVLVLALICIGLAVLFTSTPVCPAVAP